MLQSNVRIDLLITDIGLPGSLTGVQMVETARADRPDLKVLFVTGYPTDVSHLEANTHMLTKPFSLEMLSRRVEEILRLN